MKQSQYSIFARALPTIITTVPLLILYYYSLMPLLADFVGSMLVAKIIGGISFITATTYLYLQSSRIVGKIVEDKLFINEHELPTTQLLLFSNTKYSSYYKQLLHNKIKIDFNLALLNQLEESRDLVEAKKRIVEAVALIRNKTRGSSLLLQHNYEYGFIRNLVGGSTFGLIFSLANIGIFLCISDNQIALSLSILLTIVFLAVIILRVPIIKFMGYKYAMVLFSEYYSFGNN